MSGMKSIPIKALQLIGVEGPVGGQAKALGERLVQISASERHDTGQHLR